MRELKNSLKKITWINNIGGSDINSAGKDVKKIVKGLFILWLISFLIIEGLVLNSVRSDKNISVDQVIVLGAGLQGTQLSSTLYYRLNKSLEYLKCNPQARVVVSL